MRITIMALAGLGLASAAQANILISEYVEGGGYNKAIELHNAGEVSESLDGYTLALLIGDGVNTTRERDKSGKRRDETGLFGIGSEKTLHHIEQKEAQKRRG